jgi:hypothetical protein
MPRQVHDRVALEGPAKVLGEVTLRTGRPAQKRRPGAFQTDELAGSKGGLLAVRQADRCPEQAGGGDGPGIGWPPVPRTAGVAVPDPQIVQCRADGMVVALFPAEQAEPAAWPQQPGGLAERDLRVDPVERGAGNDQVEGSIGRVQILATMDGPMSMAVKRNPWPASRSVSWPVPQPISRTAAPGARAAVAVTNSVTRAG